ncbi:MAG: DUF4368 domain-containing protein, partial [Abditibacteriota bacterium]|nr:DUF4368 domain-containing protein [Abditibacteriota bacterium]
LMDRYESERLDKVERLEALEREVTKAKEETAAIGEWAKHIRKYMDLCELDREIIDELIDHIEVGDAVIADGQKRQNVKIYYRFIGHLD